MKEKIWLHISQKNFMELNNWKSYHSYDTYDSNIGDVSAVSLFTESNDFKELIKVLENRNISFEVFRREYTFTKKEIVNAEILKLIVDGNAQNSFSPDHDGYTCPVCREKVQFKQVNNLQVDYKVIKKYDISTTYMGHTEIIVSERVKNILIKEQITGIRFVPVYQIGKVEEIIPEFHHLMLEEGIGEVVEPSIVDKDIRCSKCGFYKKFLCQTPLNFKRNTWNNKDICFTENWFGAPPLSQGKWVIISKRLYSILKENKIKAFSVEPAFFID